jgi:hypothetical protein
MNNQELRKLKTLYEYIYQGSICASDEYARAAFDLTKQRMEMLFAEYFEVVKA